MKRFTLTPSPEFLKKAFAVHAEGLQIIKTRPDLLNDFTGSKLPDAFLHPPTQTTVLRLLRWHTTREDCKVRHVQHKFLKQRETLSGKAHSAVSYRIDDVRTGFFQVFHIYEDLDFHVRWSGFFVELSNQGIVRAVSEVC
jgi:hypothetical protein